MGFRTITLKGKENASEMESGLCRNSVVYIPLSSRECEGIDQKRCRIQGRAKPREATVFLWLIYGDCYKPL